MQQHLGVLARRAHQPAERLVDLLQTRNLVDTAEGRLAAEIRERIHPGLLHGIDLRQGGSDDHGVGHTAAEQIDALGKTAAEHEEKRVGEHQAFLDPGGLRGEIGQLGLQRHP